MKFARQYEPAILVYRQTRAPGGLLLRLGRIYDDGEHRLETETIVDKDFAFATHIVAKDTRGLLLRLQARLSKFAQIDAQNLDALWIDYPALKAEIESGGNDALMAELETLWGAPALEAILDLPVLTSRTERRRLAQLHRHDSKMDRDTVSTVPPWLSYAISGFIAIVAIPVGLIAVLDPDRFDMVVERGESVLMRYVETNNRNSRPDPQGGARTGREMSEAEREREAERLAFLEQVRATKQSLFVSADLGPLGDDRTYTRTIPVGDARTELASARNAATPDAPDTEDGTPRILPPPPAQIRAMADHYGLPTDLAGFRLVDANTYRLGPLENGTPSFGLNAYYDVRVARNFILQAAPEDLDGLANHLDSVVADACDEIGRVTNWTMYEDNVATGGAVATHAANATIVLEVGKSKLAGISISEDICDAGSYDIFTLFEFIEPPENDTAGARQSPVD